MLLTDMKIDQEVWFKHPEKDDFYLGIIKQVGHRPRIGFNQMGMHGKTMFPYSQEVYPKEAFEWCSECDGDGFTNYSCCGVNMRGADIDICPDCKEHWPTDHQEECSVCGGKGVLKTETTKT